MIKPKEETPKKTIEEIREIRKAGILINDDGVYCRQVPECGCGLCWENFTSDYKNLK